MKPIKFKEVNVILAENQPQYLPLPIQLNNEVPGSPAWCKYEMSDAEFAILSKTKCIYIQQLTFCEPIPLEDKPDTVMGYHPIYPCVENPWRQLPIKYERLGTGTVAAWVPLIDNTEREVHGLTFGNLVDNILSEFPELVAENLNFVMKNPPDIINNRN